jgi:hypothetical protein
LKGINNMTKYQAEQCIESLLNRAKDTAYPEKAVIWAQAAKDASIAISFMIRSGLITQ